MSGRRCRRDGCSRRTTNDYCTHICLLIDRELAKLQAIYKTADDSELDRSVWASLVELSDQWTAFQRARGALVRDIRSRGLPLP